MATMNLPAWGYGLRYQYGMFFQGLKDGYQFEKPDFWLRNGNPWEIERLDVQVPVKFYGSIRSYKGPSSHPCLKFPIHLLLAPILS